MLLTVIVPRPLREVSPSVSWPSHRLMSARKPMRLCRALGNRWKEVITRAMASTLCDRNVGIGTVIWFDESEEWLTWYAEYEDVQQLQGLVEHFRYFYQRWGVVDDCDLPASAQPVLKVVGRGEIMRFWAPPGPRLPEKHTVDVEGNMIVFHERCYAFHE